MRKYKVLIGDVIDRLKTLPDESVHCVVTSPPYWGLRDYGVEGQIGLEPTPEEFITKMVAVFREVRRVLRFDGTCWINMGDSYNASPGQRKITDLAGPKQSSNNGSIGAPSRSVEGLKPKDLMGMPWRLAFALQDDGWWLRQDIIWSKPNPMPESVTDRCTKAHEYIFLLTKSATYFYDAEAIKEPANGNAHSRGGGVNPKATKAGQNSRMRIDRDPRHANYPKSKQNERFSGAINELVTKRNKRSVWTIPTEAYEEAHFATFPKKLVEPCILAGTSEMGCCAECGAPMKRELKPSERYAKVLGKGFHDHADDMGKGMLSLRGENNQNRARDEAGTSCAEYVTVGWNPTCECAGETMPCVVMDPFSGSGTTGVVALRAGRSYIGIELNPEYADMSEQRIGGDNPLFNQAVSE